MFNVSSWWNFISCKIPLLSSNTKKGEIERTCPRFWVLVNNNRIYLMCVMGIDHVWDKYSYNQQQPKRKRSLSSDWMCNHLQTGLSGADNPAYQNLVSTDKGQHSVPGPDIWKYPGRIIRSGQSWFSEGDAHTQYLARIIANIRAGLSGVKIQTG